MKEQMNFRCKVEKGKLFFRNRQYFDFMIAQMPDGKYKLWLEKIKYRRTDKQNRYYWGVLNDIIMPALAEKTGYSEKEIHDIFKQKFLLPKKVVWRGQEITLPPSTTKLTRGEFMEFFERVKVEAADLGLIVPTPDEYYKNKDMLL